MFSWFFRTAIDDIPAKEVIVPLAESLKQAHKRDVMDCSQIARILLDAFQKYCGDYLDVVVVVAQQKGVSGFSHAFLRLTYQETGEFHYYDYTWPRQLLDHADIENRYSMWWIREPHELQGPEFEVLGRLHRPEWTRKEKGD